MTNSDPEKTVPQPPASESNLGETMQTLHASASDASTTQPARADEGRQLVPGYAIESELGRGGMGVVYRARQMSLNRLVALKMIKQADLAGTEDRLRFRREAEALAKLDHPNIVRVYEVGEHEGKPFFSMEYVAGGNLDKLVKQSPLEERDAAALVEKLARAMQVAHDAGIIHRDLKPANILLSSGVSHDPGNSEPGRSHAPLATPKITDFGLAKTLGEAGQTQSGEVMGTPAYMAPEQAAGKIHQIDARTDVYALGVILYECLTGQPPFRAATAMDTLLEVMQREAPSLRIARPHIHSDLTTICHKCLQKDPAKRYAGASELAEDLRRFLAREPILARPVTRLERAWRWCRRNPGIASAASVALLALIAGTIVSTVFAFQATDNAHRADEKAELADNNALLAAQKAQLASTSAQEAQRIAGIATQQRNLSLDVFDQLLQAVQSQLRDTPENRQVKESLLETARNGLARLSKASEGEVDPDPKLADAHIRLAGHFSRLGNIRTALKEYDAALAVFDRILAARPDPKLRLQRERTRMERVGVQLSDDPVAAHKEMNSCIQQIEDLLKSHSDEATHEMLATASQSVGRYALDRHELDEAERHLNRARKLLEQLPLDKHSQRQTSLANTFISLGALHEKRKATVEARTAYQQAEQRARTALKEHPGDGNLVIVLVLSLLAQADIAESPTKSQELCLDGYGQLLPILKAEQFNMHYQSLEAVCCRRLAESFLKQGEKGTAREYSILAQTAIRKVLASDVRHSGYPEEAALIHEQAAHINREWKGTIAERNHLRQALSFRKASAGTTPDDTSRTSLLALHRQLAEVEAKLARPSAAREQYDQAINLAKPLSDLVVLSGLLNARAALKETADEKHRSNSLGMNFVLIKSGTYQRGGEQPPKEIIEEFSEVRFGWDAEHPRHEVRLTRSFYLGATEVTRGQFRAFVEAQRYVSDAERTGKPIGDFNPSSGSKGRVMADWKAEGNVYLTDDHAVSGVSWNDAVAFCKWLSQKEGKKYRLPTEAEWEYACRAGTTTRYFSGTDPESLLPYANLPDASYHTTNPQKVYRVLKGRDGIAGLALVGSFAPNPWGLHDMTGNVWEWCLDAWDPKFYEKRIRDDPLAPGNTPRRPMRGGCFM